jgi:hypothetical protein
VPYDTLNAAVEEMDTGYPPQDYNSAAGSYGDPNPFYGRVVYGPALAVDQPLSVTRYEYRDFPNGAHLADLHLAGLLELSGGGGLRDADDRGAVLPVPGEPGAASLSHHRDDGAGSVRAVPVAADALGL